MEGTNMTISEYAAMRELECENHKGWGAAAALWVIAAVIVVAFFVYSWHQNCNERTQFAVGLANLTGRINCMEPDVRWAGQQLYKANGTIQSIDRGTRDMAQNFGDQLFQLNDEIFYNNGRSSRGCGCNSGCNNGRKFTQTSNYNLASQSVAVTETCGGCGCNA